MKIVNAYSAWAGNETKDKIVIAYETMWGATERMARGIMEGVSNSGVSVKLYDINQSDRTEIIGQMLDAKGFVVGSSTHGNDLLPAAAGFLEFLKGLKPKGRVGAAFGSYGWSGGATASIEEYLKEAGVEVIQPSLMVKYMPDGNERQRCHDFGVEFAKAVRKGS
jgi:flavorubredoxin